MARTDLTVEEINRSGLSNPTFTAAIVDGHKFINDGNRTFIYVKNANASTLTVTIQTPATADGLAVAERTVSILTTDEAVIGPFPANIYNQTDGKVYVDYDIQASVTIAIMRLASR